MASRKISAVILALLLTLSAGCAQKADPKRSIEKIQQQVATMSLAQLEKEASDYAAAIRAQKAAIEVIQQKIQKMPLEKAFGSNSMTRRIAEIGRTAEALFERYRIYAQAYQEKGGDFAKIQIELPQPQ
jgi:cytochrome c556